MSGLDDEQGAEDVDAVGGFEVFLGDVLEGRVARDAGVVDDDVDLEGFVGRRWGEVVFGNCEEGGYACWGADVALGGHGADVVGGGELLCEGGGELGGRG